MSAYDDHLDEWKDTQDEDDSLDLEDDELSEEDLADDD